MDFRPRIPQETAIIFLQMTLWQGDIQTSVQLLKVGENVVELCLDVSKKRCIDKLTNLSSVLHRRRAVCHGAWWILVSSCTSWTIFWRIFSNSNRLLSLLRSHLACPLSSHLWSVSPPELLQPCSWALCFFDVGSRMVGCISYDEESQQPSKCIAGYLTRCYTQPVLIYCCPCSRSKTLLVFIQLMVLLCCIRWLIVLGR